MTTVTEIKKERISNGEKIALLELAGLSTDEKPTEMGTTKIDNGSVLIEMDTQKIFFFDAENEEWKGE